MKRIILSFWALFFLLFNSYAQGYKLEINITNASDSLLLLAVHMGDSKYVRDSAYMDKNGKAVFAGDKYLDPGVYIIAMSGDHLFDFIISDEQNQQFSMAAIRNDYTGSLRVKGSGENEMFADLNRLIAKQQKREDDLRNRVQKNMNDKKVIEEAENEEREIKQEYHDFVEKIADKHPKSLLLSLAKAMDRPQLPKFNIDELHPKYDSIYTMQYYLFTKQHFFDNYNFTDARLTNTPILVPSLSYYFDKVITQSPDSIILAVDVLLQKAQSSPEMMRYIVGHLFNKYLASDIMGMESIVVHLIDNYYLQGKAGKHEESWMKDVERHANRNRNTLIGKQAADLKMQNLGGQYESLYGSSAPYILVYFYEPTCGHCKEETPKMHKIYEQYRDKGLEVFAVYTQQDKNEWMKYVSTNGLDWINVWDPNNDNNFRHKYDIYSTPWSILLDKDRKIIARRVNSEGIDKILNNLLGKKQ